MARGHLSVSWLKEVHLPPMIFALATYFSAA